MGLFHRKKGPAAEGVHTQQGLSYLCNRSIRYAASRVAGAYGETVIGRSGYVNCADGRIIVCCEGKTVFDRPLAQLTVGELMSRNGATFTYTDESDGKKKTVTAYYTDYAVR